MSNRTVYVGNVAHHVTQDILITFFSVCGTISNIKIAGDPSYPSLFAFIEFADPSCAATALNLNGQELGGKPIKVSLSRTNINTPFDPTGNNYVPVTHGRTQDPELTGRTIYVSGIDSQQVSEQHLLDFFSGCGNITNYRMCGDPSKSSRFAFIEFSNIQEAVHAQSLNGTPLGASTLKISPSKSAIQRASPRLTTLAPHQRDAVHRTVHVGNVDISLTEDYIRDFFTNICGLVSKVALAGDTNHSSRFAFVEFDRIEGFQEALKLSGTKLGPRTIKVSPSRSPILAGSNSERSPAGGSYSPYGNYYGGSGGGGGGGYYGSWGYGQNGYSGGYNAYGYDMSAYPPSHHSSSPSGYHHQQDHRSYSPYSSGNGGHHYRDHHAYHHHHHHHGRPASPSPPRRRHSHDDYDEHHHHHLEEPDSPHHRVEVEETFTTDHKEDQEPAVGQKRKREEDKTRDEPESKKAKVTTDTTSTGSPSQQLDQEQHSSDPTHTQSLSQEQDQDQEHQDTPQQQEAESQEQVKVESDSAHLIPQQQQQDNDE